MYRSLKMEYIFFFNIVTLHRKIYDYSEIFFLFFLDGSKHFLNIKIGGKLNSNGFFSLSMKGFLKFHLRSKKNYTRFIFFFFLYLIK